MKRTVTVLIVLSLIWLAGSAEGRTWHIKSDGSGDAPTIQAGITAAVTGDIVLLAAGTYTGVGNRNIDFLGKAITVTSESGRDVTKIDCQRLGRGFYFHSGEGSSSVVSGVTIQEADAYYGDDHNDHGGGIYCSYSSPTISGNTISGNHVAEYGGGIYCGVGSHPAITGNTISGNDAACGALCGYGAGICCAGSYATISGNTISGNEASITGGGIEIDCEPVPEAPWLCVPGAPWPTISGNTISGNSAGYYGGGGIFIYNSSPTISGNTISGNTAVNCAHGGGICCYNSSAVINNTIIAFSLQGGGIYCEGGSNPPLTNCDIYGNAGGDALCGIDGGGNISADPLFCDRGAGNFTLNCTSRCANNPGYGRIGAFGVGCGPTAIQNTTWGRIKGMFR